MAAPRLTFAAWWRDWVVSRGSGPGGRARQPFGATVGLLALCLLALAPAVADPAASTVLSSRVLAAGVSASSVEDRQALVDKANAEVDAMSVKAGIALEQYQTAVRAQYEAQVTELLQQQQLGDSEAAWRKSGADLGRWAHLTYQNGGAAGELSAWLALVQSTSPADVSRNLVTLRYVSGDKAVVLEQAAATQRLLALRSASAQAASAAAMDAARQAEVTRQASQDLVAAQRATLLTLSTLLAQARTAAQQEAARTAAQTAARRSAAVQAAAGPVLGCGGADITQFPNGMIPAEALCPVRGATGQQLRADAAQAFDALSLAFATEHASPICVTDSYRPLAEQVSLYATKPSLAARPGTSNHGWGVAVDLCGGIQQFGTEQHQWMIRNGPGFGWFHPQWARQGGSKPEAWHWEFAG